MEVLLALAVFLLVVSGGTILSVRYLETLERALDIREAALIAGEGFEAIENIAAGEWNILENSDPNIDYGLTQIGGVWQLQSNPDVTNNQFTRAIRVFPVYRDISCQITETPGTLDPDTKRVVLTLSWIIGEKNLTRTFEKYFTNWRAPGTLCTTTQAGSLELDVHGACFPRAEHKEMHGIVFRNNGFVPITIDKMVVSWYEVEGVPPPSDEKIRSIKINNMSYWESSQGVVSGTTLDLIPNLTIQPGASVSVDRFRFNDKLELNKNYFVLKAIMSDVSQTEVSTEAFLPQCDDD